MKQVPQPTLVPPTLADIREAHKRIGAQLASTPVMRSSLLDLDTGSTVFLKCENLQRTGSFKSRGALNAVMNLSQAQRSAGVVTVSAGNHAQALAWAAAVVGAPCTVVMPATAARSKVEASQSYGATVVFEQSSMAAFERCQKIADEDGLTLVHPFDDPRIAAGAGTVGLELLEQVHHLQAVVVPVGGGGLLAGVALAVKECAPNVRVYGVEPVGAAAMFRSMQEGRAVRLAEAPKTVADGLAAPMAGELTYAVTRKYVDRIILVEDAAIVSAMQFLVTRTKLLVEPAGAAGLAALREKLVPDSANARIGIILSGGNVDLNRLG
jgi:threonine dehydratase